MRLIHTSKSKLTRIKLTRLIMTILQFSLLIHKNPQCTNVPHTILIDMIRIELTPLYVVKYTILHVKSIIAISFDAWKNVHAVLYFMISYFDYYY